MRIQRLDLLRYGRFTATHLALPASDSDIHIVFGPNEAGKSTALSAIEDLLFGIPANSRYNFLHDYGSMRVCAVLENGGKTLEVRRRKGNKDTLLTANEVPVTGGTGALAPFLAGADQAFFTRMFSLDHERLRKGGREILDAKDEVGQMLFSAGAGLLRAARPAQGPYRRSRRPVGFTEGGAQEVLPSAGPPRRCRQGASRPHGHGQQVAGGETRI